MTHRHRNVQQSRRKPTCVAPLAVLALGLGVPMLASADDDARSVDRLPAPAAAVERSLDADDHGSLFARRWSVSDATAHEAKPPVDVKIDTTPLRSFARECARLEAVPLIEVSEDERRRVFFGISLDGVLGLHVRM